MLANINNFVTILEIVFTDIYIYIYIYTYIYIYNVIPQP